jgi:predicted PhzF superfamily epimerase YddE/YHI9
MPVLHLVEAFATDRFTGNPAAVCVLDAPAAEDWMQRVAREMNLSETAYLHPIAGGYSLRWFTPSAEVRLCGHATLASAFTLWATGVLPPDAPARFQTLSGWLVCTPADGWVAMDFPAQPCAPCTPPAGLPAALGCDWDFCGSNGTDYLVEVRDAATVRALRPDFGQLAAIPARGFIVTSRSDWPAFDFISRFFAPAVGVDEDPVTGSAHCALGPHWQAKLNRSEFTAFQASARGGVVKLALRGDRVILRGQARMKDRVEVR